MNFFGTMKLSGLARTAAASSLWYCTLAHGIDSKLTLSPSATPRTARTRTGAAILGTLSPAARIAVISLSEDSRPRVSRTPVSIPRGSAYEMTNGSSRSTSRPNMRSCSWPESMGQQQEHEPPKHEELQLAREHGAEQVANNVHGHQHEREQAHGPGARDENALEDVAV